MDTFSGGLRRALKTGAVVFVVAATVAASVLYVRDGETVKFVVGGAVAGALIIGGVAAILAHGPRTPQSDRTEFLGKVFTFAGAAPGILLVVLGLVSASILTPDSVTPEPPTANGWATPDPTASPLTAVFVELKAQEVVLDAFGRVQQAQQPNSERFLAVIAGIAIAVVFAGLFSAVLAACARYAQATDRTSPGETPVSTTPGKETAFDVRLVSLAQVKPLSKRGRYAQLGTLGSIVALILSVVFGGLRTGRR